MLSQIDVSGTNQELNTSPNPLYDCLPLNQRLSFGIPFRLTLHLAIGG